MLKGRLGLETARVPHKDRHGLLWLRNGQLAVRDGTLVFRTLGGDDLPEGSYDIPFQAVSCVVLEPGTSVTHDALRLLARHGTGLVASGSDGVRHYASMPFGPDASAIARRQVDLWSNRDLRIEVVRRMYGLRLGEVFPGTDLEAMRGMEGARARKMYQTLARQFGVTWKGRAYDRSNPSANDDVNNAINHASTAVVAAACVATAAVGALPQLGFIHEDLGVSFCLDVADLFRDAITLPAAFAAVRDLQTAQGDLERHVRRRVGRLLVERDAIATMIQRIKEVLRVDDGRGDP